MQNLQWLHSKLVQPNTEKLLDGPTPFSWCSETFPYTVPDGYWLGFVDFHLGSKFTDGGPNQRASYLIVNNVIAVPDNVPAHFNIPIVVPENTVITAKIINNDAEQQWMISNITARLMPKTSDDWREAFAQSAV